MYSSIALGVRRMYVKGIVNSKVENNAGSILLALLK